MKVLYFLSILKQMSKKDITFTSNTPIDKLNVNLLRDLMSSLIDHPLSVEFRKPVDHVTLGLIDYLDRVKNPMDLSTINHNLNYRFYNTVEQMLIDIQLIWKNCRIYNPETHWLQLNCEQLQKITLKFVKNYFPGVTCKVLRDKTHTSKQTESKRQHKRVKKCEKQKLKNQEELKLNQKKVGNHKKQDIEELLVKLNQNQTNSEQPQLQNNHKLQKQKQSEQLDPISITMMQKCKQFLNLMDKCTDDQIAILFLIIKRRCPKSILKDQGESLSINLLEIHQSTLTKALKQLQRWLAVKDNQ